MSGKLPSGWEKVLPTFTPEDKARSCSHDWRLRGHTCMHLPVPVVTVVT